MCRGQLQRALQGVVLGSLQQLSESSCSLATGIAQAPEMRGPIWAYVPVDLTRKLTEEFWGSANGSFVKLGVPFWESPQEGL